MPQVVACFKWVLDEADIVVRPDRTVDSSRARGKISDYDRQAVQAAVEIAQALGAQAHGLTFGPESSRASLKDALSRGLDECHLVKHGDAADVDGRATARALAAGLACIDDVQLVVLGDGSADVLARQVASRVGAILDWPVVTSVSQMCVEDGALVARRTLEDVTETVRVQLPAVVAVLPEINQPPLPGLKAIMAAKNKPTTALDADALGVDLTGRVRIVQEQGYVMARKNEVLKDGTAQEKAQFLFDALKKEGVL